MAVATATDPWNRVDIPTPAIHCLVTVRRSDVTGKSIVAITKGCYTVCELLKSKVFGDEEKILHSLLYINHNPLGYHKPYLALKQVQQCLNRLSRMNLQSSVKHFLALLPKKRKLENAESCSVPSQPLIEFVSVKILGGCKLILRLMNCCCKAFHLTIQHLHLREFIVLNLVVSGLLSRLWVFFRGILKALTSVYGPIYGLLQVVTRAQQMPYFKGFTFPISIQEFLDPDFSEIMKQKFISKASQRKGASGLLNKLFLSQGLSSKSGLSSTLLAPKKLKKVTRTSKQSIDAGQPLRKKRNNENLPDFDIKTLLKKPQNPKKDVVPPENLQDSKKCRERSGAVSSCADPTADSAAYFALKIQSVCTFKELSAELQIASSWCRKRKLRSKVLFLGNKRLKSTRLHHLEALGYSLEKKLKCVKTSVCRCLLHDPRNKDPDQYVFRRLRCKRMQHHRKNALRKQSRLKISQDTKRSTQKNQSCSPRRRKLDSSFVSHSLTQTVQSFGDMETISETRKLVGTPCVSESSETLKSSKRTGQKSTTHDDDIDDIFELIGI